MALLETAVRGIKEDEGTLETSVVPQAGLHVALLREPTWLLSCGLFV